MARPTMTMGSKYAIATARAKQMGYKTFKESTPGYHKREDIIGGLQKRYKIVPGEALRKAARKRAMRGGR